jgi:RimJ/RimL family protein N-acetyltransferase
MPADETPEFSGPDPSLDLAPRFSKANDPPTTHARNHTIRLATTEDRAQWVALYEAIAAERDWIGGEPPFPEGRVAQEFDRRSQPTQPKSAGALFVVELAIKELTTQSNIVGWIDLHEIQEPRSLCIGMGIGENHRGLGLGGQLIRTVFGFAETVGIHSLTLDVFTHNERAIRLYRSFGFVETGRTHSIDRRDGRTFQSLEMVHPGNLLGKS